MNTREFIKLFVPPLVTEIRIGIHNRKKPQASPLSQISKNTDKVVIMGNGPSLNESVDKYLDTILKYDRMAVNFFASSDLYERVKPNIYVFADPGFFVVPENFKNSMAELADNLYNKTLWPMKIVVPVTAKGAPLIEKLEGNKNITFDYYFNGEQYVGKLSKFEAWDKNYIGPPAQTVLNLCLYLALYWNYDETYLIGADSSFLEDLRVDQETNELYTLDHHFYKRDKVYSQKDKNQFDPKRGVVKKNRTVGSILHLYSIMFIHYEELRKYADYKGLKVYNASEYSWIDCFERKKLDTL